MTFSQFFGDFLAVSVNRPPHIRLGQHFYNYLRFVRPDLSDGIVGTPLDPFYKEDVPAATLDFVEQNW